MANIEDILAGVKLPERTTELCLRGDLQAQFEDLERQLKSAEMNADDALAGGSTARDLAERIEAVRQQMAENMTVFRFRALGGEAYQALYTEHGPTAEQRENGQDINWDTWPIALVAACAIDPVMSYEQAQRLFKAVTNAQWDDLWAAAFGCNRKKVDVPFSLSASAIRASFEPRSLQPERGASAPDDSLAGSLAG